MKRVKLIARLIWFLVSGEWMTYAPEAYWDGRPE